MKECPEPVTRIELVSTAWKAAMLFHYTTRTGGSPTVHDTETLQGFKAANDCLNILAIHFRFQTTVVFSEQVMRFELTLMTWQATVLTANTTPAYEFSDKRSACFLKSYSLKGDRRDLNPQQAESQSAGLPIVLLSQHPM